MTDVVGHWYDGVGDTEYVNMSKHSVPEVREISFLFSRYG